MRRSAAITRPRQRGENEKGPSVAASCRTGVSRQVAGRTTTAVCIRMQSAVAHMPERPDRIGWNMGVAARNRIDAASGRAASSQRQKRKLPFLIGAGGACGMCSFAASTTAIRLRVQFIGDRYRLPAEKRGGPMPPKFCRRWSTCSCRRTPRRGARQSPVSVSAHPGTRSDGKPWRTRQRGKSWPWTGE